MQVRDKTQFKRAEAIALVGDKKRMLERELKAYDGVREVRRAQERERVAISNYKQISHDHPLNGIGTTGRVFAGIFSLGTSEIAGAASHNAAISEACGSVDRAKAELSQVRSRHNIWEDCSTPSKREIDLERTLGMVNDKYEELQRVRSDTVYLQGDFYDMSNNQGLIANNVDSFSNQGNMAFR